MSTLCPGCHAPLASGSLCARCGGDAQSDDALRAVVQGIAQNGELREATVLFCDLGGYTAWNEEEEPEAVVAVMDRIKLRAMQIFEAHGGLANQFIGDEIVGLFGVSAVHEDDPSRAVAAALALHAYVHAQQVKRADGQRRQLELHTGIETGKMFVRVTDLRGGIFDLTGDAVNTAARLRASASSGEILLGPGTHARITARFATETLAPVTVRGKALPLARHRVTGMLRADPPRAARAGKGSPYVGRARELDLLSAAWDDARAGRGALITIEGVAGIGKSRLCEELRRRVAERSEQPAPRILLGRCAAFDRAPYQPFIEALLASVDEADGSLEGRLIASPAFAALSPEHAQVLARLLAPTTRAPDEEPGQAELRRAATLDALQQFVARSAAERPVLLVLEDFHDADEPSRAALRHVVLGCRQLPVLTLVNFRPIEWSEPIRGLASTHLALAPLDEPSTRHLSCSVLEAQALSAELAAYIHGHSAGTPYFVEEICRSLAEGGALTRRFGLVASTPSLRLSRSPEGVQSVVRARVERLEPAHKKVLRLAAVLGPEFPRAQLEALWPYPPSPSSPLLARPTPAADAPLAQLLAELSAQQLLVPTDAQGDRYRFQHAITCEVVYESLSRGDRRWYHEQVARLIEAEQRDAEGDTRYALSHHYGRSANGAKALTYALAAADDAWQSFSLEQAATQYARAIGLLSAAAPSPSHKRQYVDTSVRWARVALYNPHPAQLDALRTARCYAHELGDARAACLCLNWMSWIAYALGDQPAAALASTEFLAAAEALDDEGLGAQAVSNLGLSHAVATEYVRAVPLFEQSIARRGRTTGTAYAFALGYLGMIRGDQGAFAEAFADLDEAAQIVEAAGRDTLRGPLLVQRGIVHACRGDWSACVRTGLRAEDIAERIGGHYIRAMSLAIRGYGLGMGSADEREEGLALLQQGVVLLEAIGIRLHLSWCFALLAELFLAAGRHEHAREAALSALGRAAENERLGEVAAERVLARIALVEERDAERAQLHLERAEQAAAHKQSVRERALTQYLRARLLPEQDAVRAGSALELARRDLCALGMDGFLATRLLDPIG